MYTYQQVSKNSYIGLYIRLAGIQHNVYPIEAYFLWMYAFNAFFILLQPFLKRMQMTFMNMLTERSGQF